MLDLKEKTERAKRWETMTAIQKQDAMLREEQDMLEKLFKRNAISEEQYKRGLAAIKNVSIHEN